MPFQPASAPCRRWGAAAVLLAAACLPGVSLADNPPSTPDTVAQVLKDIEAQQPTLPRDRIDVGVIANQTAGDPQKMLEWVRDNTRAVPYEGSLRGAAGVLMDRNGNSLDRSLLLARLLELGGYEARVVGATLSPDEMAKTFAGAAKPATALPAESEADAKQRKEMQDQAAAITSVIMSKAGAVSAAAPATGTTHYWAQYNDGKGWVDLDPTLPGPGGKGRAQAQGNAVPIDPSTHSIAAAAKLAQTVSMWLFVERWENGKLVESPLLSVPFDAAREPVASVTLAFAPVDQKAGKAVQRVFTSGAQLRQKVLLENAWTPILADGKSGGRMARMFNDAGIVGDLPKSFDGAAQMGNAARSTFGGFGGALGGGGGGDDAGSGADAPTVLTALIADYQITVPNQPIRHVRRFVFDSIGPEARASTQPIPKPKWTEQQKVDRGAELAAINDTLVSFASLPSDAYIYRYATRVIDSKDAALKAAKGKVDPATFEKAANGRSFRTLELFAAARDSSVNPDLVIAEPQIYRRIVRYVPDAKAQELDVQAISDLAWNRLAPAASGGATGNAAAAVVNQGVLDTLQEAVVVLRDGPAAPGDATAALMAEAGKQGIDVVAIRNAQDPNLAAFPAEARARMLHDLAAGQVLVGPAKPVVVDGRPRAGWWRIDPSSGQTVGEMDTGLLQEIVDYAETHEVNGIQITRFGRIRVGPAARQWAEHMMRRRAYTSWNQWTNLLRYAQESINTTGLLPPW